MAYTKLLHLGLFAPLSLFHKLKRRPSCSRKLFLVSADTVIEKWIVDRVFIQFWAQNLKCFLLLLVYIDLKQETNTFKLIQV